MTQDDIWHIRDYWRKLRLFRPGGTFLVDYRILKNFVRIHQTPEETA